MRGLLEDALGHKSLVSDTSNISYLVETHTMLSYGFDEQFLVAVGRDRSGEEDDEQLRAVGVGCDIHEYGKTSAVD